MKMEIKLEEKEIKIAIEEYLNNKGFKTINMRLNVTKGDPKDPRESCYSYTSATIRVETVEIKE